MFRLPTVGALDKNIVPLVDALNDLPGMETLASCGGHEQPDELQCPVNEWFVSFQVERVKLRGLHIILDVLAKHIDVGIKLTAHYDGNCSDDHFGARIYGTDIAPDFVADLLNTRALNESS